MGEDNWRKGAFAFMKEWTFKWFTKVKEGSCEGYEKVRELNWATTH
jgi:hypothetical protein